VPATLPPVEADPDLLEQVLRNLYENAVKYSPDGGLIRTATRDLDRIEIDVADQGIGIAPEHVGAVFERFRRVGGDPTVRGMGLGLYLSRHLIEAQGGQIRAGSPGPGLGSVFTIALPIAHGWADPEQQPPPGRVEEAAEAVFDPGH
jgi:signal transduction histidine kinase